MQLRSRTSNLRIRVVWLFPLLLLAGVITAQQQPSLPIGAGLTKPLSDTTRKKGDTTVTKIDTLNLKISKDTLSAPVRYTAADSGVLVVSDGLFYLYGKANIKYTKLDLSASTIEIDNNSQLARAYFTKDSLGNVLDRPKLVDGDMTSESDSMFFNIKTQKGLTKSTYTKQGEMFVYAERIKKIDAQSFYAAQGRFTTCNLDTPHFAFRSPKMKLVNQKWAYSGVAYPEFEQVPLPVGIPFGIYPLSQGRHSGLLPPQFTATEQFGLGLEGLGYYKVLNDYFDIMTRANIYSYGGWTLNFSPTYRVRYKYSGGLRLDFMNTRINFKGDPDFSSTRSFNVAWFHSMDSKARPGVTFSANVNFGSTQFNELVPNNANLNFRNQVYSNISYSKTWGKGMYNLTAAANHSQNNQTGQYNVSLPNLNFTVNTFYPLKKKEPKGPEKWYEKLGIGYNTQILNQFSFFDSDTPYIKYNLGEILDTMQWGAQHNIPIALPLPPAGPFQMAPSISFQERWYGQKFIRDWNDVDKKVDTIIQKGFFRAQEISFGFSVNTAVFGTFNFKKGKNLQAIRHVIRPSVGINYKPDLAGKYFYETQVDSLGNTLRFSVFDGNIISPFSEGQFGGISFGLQNNLEAKVRDKKDTSASASKKIKLIDNLSINSSYNLMADSFQLAPFNIILSTTLFENINITGATTIDPYKVNAFGRRINELVWKDGFSLGRITNGSLAISTRFQSKKKEEPKGDDPNANKDFRQFMTLEEEQAQMDFIRNNPAEFADFNVPWSLDLSYSLNFARQPKADYSGFETRVFSSVNVRGDFNMSPKWKIGGNGFYDFNTGKIQQVTMFISRELHCWQMSINVVPVGLFRSFNISINPKSAILRDLKVNRTRQFYN